MLKNKQTKLMAGYNLNIMVDITYIMMTFNDIILYITHFDSLSFGEQLNINKRKYTNKYNMNVNKQTNNNYG